MKKVSIVIPVYGQWHLVKRNVDALVQYDMEHIKEIIIVDDCSPEKNIYIFNDFVRIIQTDRNRGYAGTVNTGLKLANTDIIVLLDSDAYPIAPFISQLLSIYDKDESTGCVGFATIDDEGNTTGSYTYEPSLMGLIGGQQLELRLNLRNSDEILPFSCSVSFRKACLEQMNYFDEKNFPVLDADLDISMRIHHSRWKLLFNKDIIVCHKGGSSYKINYKRVLLFHESRWRLLKVHGMIQYPLLTKLALTVRVKAEIITFKLFKFFKGNPEYDEKTEGRKILLKRIKYYE